jgi:predicted ester cyclase
VSVEENKRRFVAIFEELWNGKNLDYVEVAFHPDYVFYSPAEPEPIRGLEAYRAYIARIFGGFPDAQITMEHVMGEGDFVLGRMTLRATHAGKYLGLPPTGTPIETTQMIMGRYDGDKLREGWQEIDALRLVQQLGVVPPPGVGPIGLLGWSFRTIARIARLSARSARSGR